MDPKSISNFHSINLIKFFKISFPEKVLPTLWRLKAKVAWARKEGLGDAKSQRPVDTVSLFQPEHCVHLLLLLGQ